MPLIQLKAATVLIIGSATAVLLHSSGCPAKAEDGIDTRGIFQATAYYGLAIDTFAASELRLYLNPEASSQVEEEDIAGFDFSYRLVGNPSECQKDENCRNLWVYGGTIHGIRSGEVDCEKNPDAPVCGDFDDVENAGERTLFILRNATSLEAYLGLRYEFATIKSDTDSPGNFFLGAEYGFLTAEGQGSDVIDYWKVGAGLTTINGRMKGSRLEAGLGQNDLFLGENRDRYFIDGFLTWEWAYKEGENGLKVNPFVEILIDADFGDGSDSVRTLIGFDFDVAALFKKKTPATPTNGSNNQSNNNNSGGSSS
jgi:hypothetical protein